jgi:hypothetical protein
MINRQTVNLHNWSLSPMSGLYCLDTNIRFKGAEQQTPRVCEKNKF